MVERFQRTVEAQRDMVYSFAYHYLGSREDAEDVTQEVLLKLWQHFRELDFDAIPRWLNRVTRNASYDRLRRFRVQKRYIAADTTGEGETSAADRSPSPEPDPQAAAEQRDFRRHLRAALTELPDPYRSVLVLREVQGLRYREIAETLELPINTIKTHVHRGRRILRQRLREVLGESAYGDERKVCVR
jgi:RNA polymerase sigma-70 factor (ECF subfamily)